MIRYAFGTTPENHDVPYPRTQSFHGALAFKYMKQAHVCRMKSWFIKETELLDSIQVYLPSFEVSTIAIFTSNISTNSAWEHRNAEKHAVSRLGSSGLGDLNGMTMLANGYGMPTYADTSKKVASILKGLNAGMKTKCRHMSLHLFGERS